MSVNKMNLADRFEQVYREYSKPMFLYALSFLISEEEAEDVIQEVFINFWKHDLKTFPNFKTVKTFLYNSVQNRSLNYLRDIEIQRRNYQQLELHEDDDEHYMYQQIRSEVIAEIFAAIEELPEKCREIFKMSYIENQEEKEIAAQLNISVNTVKTQKLRAKNYLKTRLGDLFVVLLLLFPDL